MQAKALLISLVAACLSTSNVAAQETSPAADFFAGKKVSLYIGFTAGGYDSYGRLLGRHMGKHLAGKPDFVPLNMPGAGSMKLSLYLRDVAPRDGTAIGIVDRGLFVASFVNPQGQTLDFSQLSWIGSITNENLLCVSWHTSNVRTTQDLLTKDFVAGGISRTDISYISVSVLNNLFGAKVKFIPGYPGTNDLVLAIERGEVEGRCNWSQSSLMASRPHWLAEKKINVLLQYGMKRDSALPDVPTALEIARNDEQRSVLKFLFSPEEIARPFAAPPDLPPERLEALRKAFDATMQDGEFRAEANKLNLDVNPRTGAEVANIIDGIYKAPPEVIARAKEVIK
jgi:tripartite-type tricarboxylate transporter receptor subunit TctC